MMSDRPAPKKRVNKLKVIIEVEVNAEGELGRLTLDAKSPLRSRIFLRREFLETSPLKARELVALCFDLTPKGVV